MKIDVTKIEGFDAMSAEDKVNALMAYEVEEPTQPADNPDITKYRTLLSKANSEAAEYKNKWRATLSEQERIAQEQAEALAERDAKLQAYERNDKIHGYENSYLALGYSDELARKAAEAQLDGDMETVFKLQRDFQESQKKSWETDFLNKQPELSTGKHIGTDDIEDKYTTQARKYMGL